MTLLEMFPNALLDILDVCKNALKSGRHKPDDWKSLGITGNLEHLTAHLGALDFQTGNSIVNSDEDHLINLCCRALMALQLRIENQNKL